jgi:betaine lipid synthase
MDHLDWFNPESTEAGDEVSELQRVVAPGGFVLFRSAAKRPWYRTVFEEYGFKIECLGMRDGAKFALDRVNM